ncbi:MAG: hypothetical protein MK135_15105, partial [Polyangiaceae bacterium]|nr:hypothetical protein [Polyangiaceae bacterium]
IRVKMLYGPSGPCLQELSATTHFLEPRVGEVPRPLREGDRIRRQRQKLGKVSLGIVESGANARRSLWECF